MWWKSVAEATSQIFLEVGKVVHAGSLHPLQSSKRGASQLGRKADKKWHKGDFLSLWSEVMGMQSFKKTRRKPEKNSAESLLAGNARRAHCAMEVGQYRKAISP
jgi:hypothetical protein